MWDFDGGGDKLVAGNKMVTEHPGTQGLLCRGIVDMALLLLFKYLQSGLPFSARICFCLRADSGEFGINLTKQGRILNVI